MLGAKIHLQLHQWLLGQKLDGSSAFENKRAPYYWDVPVADLNKDGCK